MLLISAAVAGKEVEELWHEYESASSPEAELVKDFDKVRLFIVQQDPGYRALHFYF